MRIYPHQYSRSIQIDITIVFQFYFTFHSLIKDTYFLHSSTNKHILDITGLCFHKSTTIWYCSNMQLVLSLTKYLEIFWLKRNGSEIIDMQCCTIQNDMEQQNSQSSPSTVNIVLYYRKTIIFAYSYIFFYNVPRYFLRANLYIQ